MKQSTIPVIRMQWGDEILCIYYYFELKFHSLKKFLGIIVFSKLKYRFINGHHFFINISKSVFQENEKSYFIHAFVCFACNSGFESLFHTTGHSCNSTSLSYYRRITYLPYEKHPIKKHKNNTLILYSTHPYIQMILMIVFFSFDFSFFFHFLYEQSVDQFTEKKVFQRRKSCL